MCFPEVRHVKVSPIFSLVDRVNMIPQDIFPLEIQTPCIPIVVFFMTTVMEVISEFFYQMGWIGKKNNGMPENLLLQKLDFVFPVFIVINDLFDDAPLQQERMTSNP